MGTDLNFKIDGQNYTPQQLNLALKNTNANFNNWSGARKIELLTVEAGLEVIKGREVKYNEILKAVSNAIHERKNKEGLFAADIGRDSFVENNAIRELMQNIIRLQDAGHEDTGFLYTLFRRIIPNMFRGRDISNLESKVKNLYPTEDEVVEGLKNYIVKNKINNKDEFKQKESEYLIAKDIEKCALIVDYLTSNPATQDDPSMKIEHLDPSSKEVIFKALNVTQLQKYVESPLGGEPLKVKYEKLESKSYVNDLFIIYSLLHSEVRGTIFPEIDKIIKREDQIFVVIDHREHNLSQIAERNSKFDKEIKKIVNSTGISSAKQLIAYSKRLYSSSNDLATILKNLSKLIILFRLSKNYLYSFSTILEPNEWEEVFPDITMKKASNGDISVVRKGQKNEWEGIFPDITMKKASSGSISGVRKRQKIDLSIPERCIIRKKALVQARRHNFSNIFINLEQEEQSKKEWKKDDLIRSRTNYVEDNILEFTLPPSARPNNRLCTNVTMLMNPTAEAEWITKEMVEDAFTEVTWIINELKRDLESGSKCNQYTSYIDYLKNDAQNLNLAQVGILADYYRSNKLPGDNKEWDDLRERANANIKSIV